MANNKTAQVSVAPGVKLDTPDDIITASQPRKRELYVYDVPESIRGECGGAEAIAIVELLPHEEVIASKRAGVDAFEISGHLAREALRRVKRDGNWAHCSTNDGSADVEFVALHAKGRSLLINAYSDIHNPKQAAIEGFLASRKVITG